MQSPFRFRKAGQAGIAMCEHFQHLAGVADELGDRAVEVVHPIKDLHVTVLHLLGLNDNKLTYFHEGRFKQLSQTGGQVIKELIA